jgi:hypothetical protein
MRKLLERNVASAQQRLMLLAPPHIAVPASFGNVTIEPRRHAELLEEMQRLRGRIYVQDGAVEREQLSPDGLHRTPEDERSWHLLVLNAERRVSSCAWYMPHDDSADFEQLRVRNNPLARHESWRDKLRDAVRSERSRASLEGLQYAEVGGWAVAEECRCTSEGLVIALAAYSRGRALGGALGLTTATVRHASSTILKRLGGSLLDAGGTSIPPYYDPRYKCDMELLRFDSREPGARYGSLIDVLVMQRASVPVIAYGAVAASHGSADLAGGVPSRVAA